MIESIKFSILSPPIPIDCKLHENHVRSVDCDQSTTPTVLIDFWRSAFSAPYQSQPWLVQIPTEPRGDFVTAVDSFYGATPANISQFFVTVIGSVQRHRHRHFFFIFYTQHKVSELQIIIIIKPA